MLKIRNIFSTVNIVYVLETVSIANLGIPKKQQVKKFFKLLGVVINLLVRAASSLSACLVGILLNLSLLEINMASANVDAVLKYLMDTPVMVHELHLVFAKIEAGSGVRLSNEEKVEFLKEIAGTATSEPSITFKW